MYRFFILLLCLAHLGDSLMAQPSDSYNTALWKKFDTPPGADPNVPDSLGGAGFEKIAAQMGFVTYSPKPAELKYFGDPRAKVGGAIRFTTYNFPQTFRPEGQGSNSIINQDIKGMVYETLLSTHPVTQEYIPSLASHWKISEDKRFFTFRIDPNARFSDGKRVTAEDVVASWNLLMDETLLEPSNQLVYGAFDKPVVLSTYLVQIHCKKRGFRHFLYLTTALYVQPAHEIASLSGREYLNTYKKTMPAGSGEYILLQKDIQEMKGYVLTRRNDYWAKDYATNKYVGNFDSIAYSVVRDNLLLEYEMLKGGQSDVFRFNMLTTEKWVKDSKYEALSKGWMRRCRIFNNAPMGTQGYAFNMRKEPFNDIRVRKAFAYLFPRKQIIEQQLYNEYIPFNSHYPNTVYANPTNEQWEFSPEKANKLLDEAGWKVRNSAGIRTKKGEDFSIVCPLQTNLLPYLKPYIEQLKKAGIELQIDSMNWQEMLRRIDSRDFTIAHVSYGGLLTPNPETSLLSTLAAQDYNNNIHGVTNLRIDALCSEYNNEYDLGRRIAIIREIDKLCDSLCFDIMSWNPKGIRLAFWDKFGVPEFGLPRFAQLSYVYSNIATTWWYDEAKAKRLAKAVKEKKSLGNSGDIEEIRFWDKFK